MPLRFQEVVLSSEQDAFFKTNMYENFGDIGMSIKRMVDDFQQVAKSNQNIQTIGLYLARLSIHIFDNLDNFYGRIYLNRKYFELLQKTWPSLLTATLSTEKCMAMFQSM